MADPIAYSITFRCYGTWLDGDSRGSFVRPHQRIDDAPLRANRDQESWKRTLMKHPPLVLDNAQRAVAHRALVELCAERGWDLHVLNVRTNHVHLVVTAAEQVETVMGTMKGRATRELRAAGLVTPERPCWSRHGSTRRVWDQIGLEVVCTYVRDAQ